MNPVISINRKSNNLDLLFILFLLLFVSCDSDGTSAEIPKTIVHMLDGRIVRTSAFSPILLDVNKDGFNDYNIFCERVADSKGEHIYFGINPLGPNLIKSGPPNDNNYLNMGFAISEQRNSAITRELNQEERWTVDHSTFVIKHFTSEGIVSYEGFWANNLENVVGFQLVVENRSFFGWLRLGFHHDNEELTLVDLAYETTEEKPIMAGVD